MKQERWQLKVRLPIELREPAHQLAAKNDRSVNYLFIKAMKEFIARNNEAPATCDSQGL